MTTSSETDTKRVVTFLPSGWFGRIMWPLVLLAGACGLLWVSVSALQTVRLVCDRPAAKCSIVSSPSLSPAVVIPLGSIRGSLLEATTSRSAGYSVALRTSSGQVELSITTADRASRAEQKAAVDAFLADPTQTRLDVIYDRPSWLALFGLVLSFGLAAVAWPATWYANVEVDGAEGTLDVVVVRWPGPSKRRRFRLDAVRDAVVTRHSMRGTWMYSVALVVDGHEKHVRLLRSGDSSNREPSDRAAEEIRCLLPRRAEPAASA